MAFDLMRNELDGIPMSEIHHIRRNERTDGMKTETEHVIDQEDQDEQARHAAIDRVVQGWQPQGDRLILATMRPTEKKVGSIIVPGANSVMGDKVERRGRLARVVATGPDATVDVNTKVYCATFAGSVIEIDGHSLLVIPESELLLLERT